MKFAFVIFKYFPFGGAQRDMLRTANNLVDLGHRVDIYTLSWEGEAPRAGIQVHVIPVRAWFNYRKYQKFIDIVQARLRADAEVDYVFGYNRMPGLDAHFSADPCFVERARLRHNALYQLTPRYRWFAAAERAVFSAEAGCDILMVSRTEIPAFQRWYATPETRFHYIPPYLSRERLALQDRAAMRAHARQAFGLPQDTRVVLLVGSGFAMKGLDRAIRAVAALPAQERKPVRLIAIGQDNPKPFEQLAQRLGVADHLIVSPGRPDIPQLMQGADLQVHPAYRENTGLVILEGMASGLPLLVTESCGYAHYVQDADAGRMVPSPYDQAQFDALFREMLTSEKNEEWRRNGLAYAERLMQENDGRAEARILIDLAGRKRGQG
jgi:UDP-glucose:(heptosyl)LPS alpha-1,3-glucosyltransferase